MALSSQQARGAVADASHELVAVRTRLYKEATGSAEYTEGQAAVTAAERSYQAAVAQVMTALARQGDYQTACKAKLQASEALEKAREAGTEDSPENLALGNVAKSCASDVSLLEVQAMGNSAAVQAAKASMATARATMETRKRDVEKAIRENADYVAALEALTDAKAQLHDAPARR